jgi:hypothetical protein
LELGEPEAFGEALVLGVGLGVGVITVTLGSEHPNGTGGRVTWGAGETDTPGDGVGVAWMTIGVSRGHGAGGGKGDAVTALISSQASTTSPPTMIVPMKAAAPHSCFRKFRFKDQVPSRPMLPRQRCQVSQPMLRACWRRRLLKRGPAGRA